jgi:hypothetical protein
MARHAQNRDRVPVAVTIGAALRKQTSQFETPTSDATDAAIARASTGNSQRTGSSPGTSLS